MTNVTWLRRPFSTTFTSLMTSTAILNSYKDHVTTAAILFTQSLINPWRPYSNTKPHDTSAAILILTRLRQSRTNNLSKLLTENKLLKCSPLWASQYRSCWCSVAIKRQNTCSHSTVTITLSKVRATTANTLEYIPHHNVCVICRWYIQCELFTRCVKIQLY